MTNHNIKRALYVGAFIVFALSILSAQNSGKMSGLIKDAETGEPLIGVNVVVVGTSLGSPTDVDGNYFILNVPVGKYKVQASMVGYAKVTKVDVVVNINRTTVVDFSMTPSVVLERDVIIEATRPIVEKEKTSTSMITRSDEIQALAGMHNAGDVIALSADVTDGHFRGGRSGEVLYNLQGMGTINPLDNSNTMDPIMSAVEEVEVVTSGFGAQYGNAQSGVVNISMKEGKADKWHSYMDVRLTAPTKKHFGESPYDVSANPYLQYLMDYNNWSYSNMKNQNGKDITSNSDGPNNHVILMKDTMAMQQFSYILSKQATHMANSTYGNKPDYSLEASIGGPLDESTRMFLAMNTKISWALLPTEDPDESNQIMGNVVKDVGGGGILRLSTAYSQSTKTNISRNDNSYLGFLYDILMACNMQKNTNYQAGVRYSQTLSQSTFMEVKVNGLSTRKQVDGRNAVVDSIIGKISTNSYQLAKQPSSLAGYSIGSSSTVQDDKTQTVSLDASLTSQVTKSHLINAGVQANMYFIDVVESSGANITSKTSSETNYFAKPLEGSFYFQDKMEFEGMIANIGLRLDVWNMRTKYGNLLDSIYAPVHGTDLIGRLQPRAGFSFPVSESSVFHVNYGAYVQRPAFQYMVRESPKNSGGVYVPNPNLLPQTTNSYDLGITQALGEDLTIDISGYYKNVNDLVKQVKVIPTGFTAPAGYVAPYGYLGIQNYITYINYDYADIRGFRISLMKRRGNLTGSINYTYSVNTASSSSPSDFEIDYKVLKSAGSIVITDNHTNLPMQDVLLDYDRTHNLVVNVGYITNSTFGFEVGKVYPLADMSISLTSTASSGRPFTYNPTGTAEYMNCRMPAEYDTDIKITKRFLNVYGTTLTVYAEIFNLFNNKIFNYDYVTSSDKIIAKYLEGNYEKNTGSPATSGLVYYDPDAAVAGNVINKATDQSFVVYSNQPRSYWFGVSVEF